MGCYWTTSWLLCIMMLQLFEFKFFTWIKVVISLVWIPRSGDVKMPFYLFTFSAVPFGMWDLSSPIRD